MKTRKKRDRGRPYKSAPRKFAYYHALGLSTASLCKITGSCYRTVRRWQREAEEKDQETNEDGHI